MHQLKAEDKRQTRACLRYTYAGRICAVS